MPGPLFDEMLRVSPRSELRFSNVIFLLANYAANNLSLFLYFGYHMWSVAVSGCIWVKTEKG